MAINSSPKDLYLLQSETAGSHLTQDQETKNSMATLVTSSSSLVFSSHSSKLYSPSLSPLPRLSFSLFSQSLSSSLSISPSFLAQNTTVSRKSVSVSAFTVKASATGKKKVLIVNTNSGGACGYWVLLCKRASWFWP
ncbi:Uncharacterized protein Adt_46918 [Abeliophyllum distichum]|uniref:Uncharacterized protein n=1 Tax=Abeliophyllum distichum TaxID=126358 RepID=A0ABD1NX19_9LAMI